MKEPPFRLSTKKALNELANELNLRERIPEWDSMAGHSYTPGNPKDISQYIEYYNQLDEEDKKFTLMEMILDALADQPTEAEFLKYWKFTEPILSKDFLIHEFTVYYWKDMTNEFKRSIQMTPAIKQLITQKTIK